MDLRYIFVMFGLGCTTAVPPEPAVTDTDPDQIDPTDTDEPTDTGTPTTTDTDTTDTADTDTDTSPTTPGLPTSTFLLSNPTVTDQDGDGIWSAGETLSIVVDMENLGPHEHFWYPTPWIACGSPDVVIGQPDSPFFAAAVGQPMQAYWSVTAAANAAPQNVQFTAEMRMDPQCGLMNGNPCISYAPLNFSNPIQ